MSFTHLHLHSEYSLLDGAVRISELPSRLKELGMDACAVTDHGVMYGALSFYTALKSAGLKPIIGCEVYVAENGRLSKGKNADRASHHLVLLAQNNEGLKNLNRLVSKAFIEGYYYRPRVDLEILKAYSGGLIALSACLNGGVAQRLLRGEHKSAKELAELYSEIFGKGNYFLEVQGNGLPEQNQVNKMMRELSDETGIPLIATADCHYLRKEDAKAHDVLLCIQTGKKLSDQDRMRMGTDKLYVKSEAEMKADLPDFLDAVENTSRIAERCEADFDLNTIHLPKFELPIGESSSEQYLRRISLEKLHEKRDRGLLPGLKEKEKSGKDTAGNFEFPDYINRLNHELDVINRMGYADYYLIVWDFIRYAKENKIMVGPGRGSGAASLVAFSLGITNLDPLYYKLLFERFLNPERVSMPDFDTDFCWERRGEVIDYVTKKYGSEHVSQVITFGTLAARQSVRDVSRVKDLSFAESDRISKMIPVQLNMTLDKALTLSPELKTAYDNDPTVSEVIDTAKRLEGLPRHASTHAAGVVISSEVLTDLVPLSKNDDQVVIQYDKNNIEKLGLLKFDFLGLRTLTVLRDTRDFVKESTGELIDFDKMLYDEPEVYEMISEGDTCAVFQLESPGMTRFMQRLKPVSLEDIIAGVALYRPGPMSEIDRYVQARHDASKIRYDHPMLEPILNMTYGVIIYQEQVMQIVRDLAGFSMGQADNVRRAMSKKKPEIIEAYRNIFIHGGKTPDSDKELDGAVKRGVPEKTAEKIFNDVLAFAGYAFNKAHAACYAVVAYQTAYLKLHYPVPFMAAMLNSFLGSLEKAADYTEAAKEMGIEILPPDINLSEVKFKPEGEKAIRFALAAVKNTGIGLLENIVRERRQNGMFKSFGDFLRRASKIHVNKKAVESLIKSSALDSFSVPRNKMLAVYDLYMDGMGRKKELPGQVSFFDLGLVEDTVSEPAYPELPELTKNDTLEMEREMLGVYVSGHPLDAYRKLFRKENFLSSAALKADPENEEALRTLGELAESRKIFSLIAYVRNIKRRVTKKGELMATLSCEDFSGVFEAVVFSKNLEKYSALLKESAVLLMRGQASLRFDDNEASFIANEIFPANSEGYAELTGKTGMNRSFSESKRAEENFNVRKPYKSGNPVLQINYDGCVRDRGYVSLTGTLAYFSGTTPVKIKLSDKETAAFLPKACWVDLNSELINILASRYGIDHISIL